MKIHSILRVILRRLDSKHSGILLASYDSLIILLIHYVILSTTPPLSLTTEWQISPFFIWLSAMIARRISGLSRLKLFGMSFGCLKNIFVYAVIINIFIYITLFISSMTISHAFLYHYFVNVLLYSFLSRLILSSFLQKLDSDGKLKDNIVLYGVNHSTIQLTAALSLSQTEKVVAIIDDNLLLRDALIAGYKIKGSENLAQICNEHSVSKIIISSTTLNDKSRASLRRRLQGLDVELVFHPTVEELVGLSRPHLNASDLIISRDPSPLDDATATAAYQGKTVLVTGAGGSIASVICRQLCDNNARKVILFEQSEIALYTIQKELKSRADAVSTEIVSILGSVCDADLVEKVLSFHKPDIIFHAAAYKHVPIIEQNELVGLSNNILGTQVISEAAIKHSVQRFILISTDKAVRPTNVMGASKRISELLIQGNQNRSIKTIFASVRFGNVLESSGSAIPLFREQISNGGPVTVTHKDVTRYFMTIEEAAELVLSAGFMATGGEVFVLDMGQPIKIIDIAEKLIRAAGFKPTFGAPKDNEIQIKEIGLRDGEKLYEELLISENITTTHHPKIRTAKEPGLSLSEIDSLLAELDILLSGGDPRSVRKFLLKWVEGFQMPLHKN